MWMNRFWDELEHTINRWPHAEGLEKQILRQRIETLLVEAGIDITGKQEPGDTPSARFRRLLRSARGLFR